MSTAPVMQDQEVPQQLSDEARKGLETLFSGIMGEEKSPRRAEVRKAWQQRNFRNGNQYLWWDSNSNTYCQPEASGNALPKFMDVYNIYTPHWRSFVSILSQNPPGINFVPDDLQRSVDVTAASYAENMRHRVDRLVNMKDRQAEAASYFCTDGRTISHTWIDNAGELQVEIGGVLEWKVPIFVRHTGRNNLKSWPYAVKSKEVDLYQAKENYPDYADDIKVESDTSEMAYERYARLGILANKKGAGGHAESLKNLVTEHVAWIRPSRYRKANETVREELLKAFPEGIRATFVSSKCVDAIPEKMEDAIRCDYPAPGNGQSRPSLLHDVVPLQQAFNDYMNMLREHIDFSIPATWVTDTVDSEALAEQRSAPGVIHQITVPAGASITDLVFQEQVAQLPPELVANIDRILSLAQFVSGDLPSLSGEGDPHSETAEGQKMLSDQAKGQLSPAYNGLQWLFAGTYELSVARAAQLAADKPLIAIQGNSGQQQFSPAAILDGTWGCYPNDDSAFPETEADQRAAFQSVMTQLGAGGPPGLAIVFHPANLKLTKKYSGLKDLYIPQSDARDKQLREIEQMLQESPVPDQTKIPQWQQAVQQALATRQPPPPMPLTSSVPIGKRDYNDFELSFGVDWLSSPACFEEIQKGNQQGVDNVNLHLDLHEAAIAANAPAPQYEPPKLSGTFAITDANAISQILAKDGINVAPAEIEASNISEEQNQAADTQLKAAGAQHKAVLAAREAVTPVQKPMSPEQQLEAKKSANNKKDTK